MTSIDDGLCGGAGFVLLWWPHVWWAWRYYGRVEKSFGGVEVEVEICQIFEVGCNIRRILVYLLTWKFFCVQWYQNKSFYAFFGGAELSLYFQKTKTITQHLSYDNMTKLTLSTIKVAAAAKKRTGQWHRSPKFYGIILFLSAEWVFPLPAPLFHHSFDEQRCCDMRLNRMIGSWFLMLFSFSVRK